MIKLIIKNHKTMAIIAEKSIADNWWNVYLRMAIMDGRRIIHHSENSYSVIYTEKNKVYTLVR